MHEPGSRLGGRYRLDERIGAGGMGEVWRATDEVLGRTVAVKVMLPSLVAEPDFARRFRTEARAMASVSHPGVVAIHDYRSDAEVAFLVMELIQGEPLSHTLRRSGRLPAGRTMALVRQAAEALQAVHDRGIIHRDIKPANLLLRPDGSVVLTDFGIARAEHETHLTAPGALLGTPSYLSPEQVLGHPATPRSDVYALGLVAYECLTGRRPFDGDNPFAVALQRVREMPRTLGTDVPVPVLTVVERALVPDPAHRWPSAAALATAAHRASEGLAVGPRPALDAAGVPGVPVPGGVPGPGRPRVGLRVTAAAVVAAAVLAGAGIWGFVVAGDREGTATTTGDSDGLGGATGGAVREETVTTALEGLVPCGDLLCPADPMCWGGQVSISGFPQPIRTLGCDELHYWETYAAVPLPEEEAELAVDELAARYLDTACGESVMADRSADPRTTAGWERSPFPIEADDGVWVLHCMAGPLGESTGTAFRAG